jgi:hypothetical protein
MRDQASSNANDNFAKSTIVKAGSSFTSPKMVTDLQSSLSPSLPNRPRIVSLDFHSSPRQLPRLTLLPRNLSRLSKKLVDEHYSVDHYMLTPAKKIRLCIRPEVLAARSVRALGPGPGLGLAQSPLSSSVKFHANAELPLSPQAERPNKDKDEMMFLTPLSSFGGMDKLLPGPPVLEQRDESRILLHSSPSMPRELFVPDDF